MYHWFLLLSSPCDVTSKNTPDTRLGFVAHDDPFTASLDVSERGRLFWLGLIEFIPALSGGLGATYVESGPARAGLFVAGLLLCAVVCWLLRHRAPVTRIYSSERTKGSRP